MELFKISGLVSDRYMQNPSESFNGYFIQKEKNEIVGIMNMDSEQERSCIKGIFKDEKLFFVEITGLRCGRSGFYRKIRGYQFQNIHQKGERNDDGLFGDGPTFDALIEVKKEQDSNNLSEGIEKYFQAFYKELSYQKYSFDEIPDLLQSLKVI